MNDLIGDYAHYVTNSLPPRAVIDVALTTRLLRYFGEANRGTFNAKISSGNDNVWRASIAYESATPANVTIRRRVANNNDVETLYDTNICTACLGTSTRDRLRAVEHLLVFSTDAGVRYACLLITPLQKPQKLSEASGNSDDEYDDESLLFLERIRIVANATLDSSTERDVASRLVADIRRVFRFTSSIGATDYRCHGGVELIIVPETTWWPSSMVDILVPFDEADKPNADNAERIATLVRYTDFGHEKNATELPRGGVRVRRERAGFGRTLWSTNLSARALTVAPIDTLRSLGLLAQRLRPGCIGSIVAVEEIIRGRDWQSQHRNHPTYVSCVIPRELAFYEDCVTWHIAFLRLGSEPSQCVKRAATQCVGVALEAHTVVGAKREVVRLSERSMNHGDATMLRGTGIAPAVNEAWCRDGLNVTFEWDRAIVATRRNVMNGRRYLNLNVKMNDDDKATRRFLLPLTDVSMRAYRARIVLDEQKAKCVTWIPCIGPSVETSVRDIDELELSDYRPISETTLGGVANIINRLWYAFQMFCQDNFGYSSGATITADSQTTGRHILRIEATHPPLAHTVDDRSIRVVAVYECDLGQIEPSDLLIANAAPT